MVFLQRAIPSPSVLSSLTARFVLPQQRTPTKGEKRRANTATLPKTNEALLRENTFSTSSALAQQIALLSSHATDIFSNLAREAAASATRVANLHRRVTVLGSALPHIDAALGSIPLKDLHERPKISFRIEMNEREQLFSKDNRPTHLAKLIEATQPPPHLELLNEFMEDESSCLLKYSNPNFFFETWLKKIQEQDEEEKRLRQERRDKLRAKRKLEQSIQKRSIKIIKQKNAAEKPSEHSRLTDNLHTSIGNVQNHFRAIPSTNASISDELQIAFANPPQTPNMDCPEPLVTELLPNITLPPPLQRDDYVAPKPPLMEAKITIIEKPIFTTKENIVEVKPTVPKSVPAPLQKKREQEPIPPRAVETAEELPKILPKVIEKPTEAIVEKETEKIPEKTIEKAPKPISEKPIEIPQAPAIPTAPVAPRFELAAKEESRSAIVIPSEVKLKHVEPQPKKVETRSSLLEAIRGGISLKKVDQAPKKAAPANETSVAAILSRRIAIQESDDEDEDDSWSV